VQSHVLVYRDGSPQGPVPLEQLSDVIADPAAAAWVDLVDPDPELLRTVADELGLHRIALEDIERRYMRPKLERFSSYVVLEVQAIEIGEGGLRVEELTIVLGHGYLVSVRTPGMVDQVVEAARQRVDRAVAPGVETARLIAYCLIDEVVDGYFPVLESFDGRVESIEDGLLAGSGSESLQAALAIRRDMLLVRRVTNPMREVLASAVRVQDELFGVERGAELRDLYDHVLRVHEELELQRDLLTGLMDAYQSSAAQRLNDVILTLSAWAAILIVPTLIASIYGMNFQHMPELDWRLGYAYALALMAGSAAGLYWLFRRRGWV